MRRSGNNSSVGSLWIWIGIVLCIALATLWRRSLSMQDNIQYISQSGTAYSVGTSLGSLTFGMATRYSEFLQDSHVDWLWSAKPGWSMLTLKYGIPYVPPTPATRPTASVRLKTQYIRPAPWDTHSLGFECGAGTAKLPSGGAGAVSHSKFLTIPLWFLMLIIVAPAIISLRFRVRA